MGFLGPLPPPLWQSDNRNYRIHMPRDRTVAAACEDVDCDQWRNGWETICDLDTPEGRMVADMIRSGQSGRTYRELAAPADARVIVFRFDSGQRCFREHRTRPGRLVVQRRGRILREHTSLADLAEDYTEHTGRLAEQEKRG
jgi:hypothetical protein